MNEYLYSAAPELMYEVDRQQVRRVSVAARQGQKRRFLTVFTFVVTLIIVGVALSYYLPALLTA